MKQMLMNIEQQFESCVDRFNFWLDDCALDYQKTFFVYYVNTHQGIPKEASTKICVYVLDSAKEDIAYTGRIGYIMVDQYFFDLPFEKQCDLLLEYLLVGLFVYFFSKVHYHNTHKSLIKFGFCTKKEDLQILDLSNELIGMALDDIIPSSNSYSISNTKKMANLKFFFKECIENAFNRKDISFESPLALARVKSIKNPSKEDEQNKEKWLVSKEPTQGGKYGIMQPSDTPIKKFEFHRFFLQENTRDSQGTQYYIHPEIQHYRAVFYLVISNTKYNAYLQNVILLPTTSIHLNEQNGFEIAEISLKETQESIRKQSNKYLDLDDEFIDEQKEIATNLDSLASPNKKTLNFDKRKVYLAFNQPRSASKIRHIPRVSNDAILDINGKKIQFKDTLKSPLKERLVELLDLNKPSDIKYHNSQDMFLKSQSSIPLEHIDTFNIKDLQKGTNSTSLTLSYCKTGVLERGGNINNQDFGTIRDVKINRPFLMSQNLISVGFFLNVVNHFKQGSNEFKNYTKISYTDKNLPITNISWLEAVHFCNLLSTLNNLNPVYVLSKSSNQLVCSSFIQNNGYRLPTELEFEYAAKAGVNTTYINSDVNIYNTKYSWFDNITTTKLKLQQCGLKEPNAWQLYDMIGNVFVFCSDTFDPYIYKKAPQSTSDDLFVNKVNATNKVLKSVPYDYDVAYTHIQNRTYIDQNSSNEKTGFRICRNFIN